MDDDGEREGFFCSFLRLLLVFFARMRAVGPGGGGLVGGWVGFFWGIWGFVFDNYINLVKKRKTEEASERQQSLKVYAWTIERQRTIQRQRKIQRQRPQLPVNI
jgi:hypothetical protein